MRGHCGRETFEALHVALVVLLDELGMDRVECYRKISPHSYNTPFGLGLLCLCLF